MRAVMCKDLPGSFVREHSVGSEGGLLWIQGPKGLSCVMLRFWEVTRRGLRGAINIPYTIIHIIHTNTSSLFCLSRLVVSSNSDLRDGIYLV